MLVKGDMYKGACAQRGMRPLRGRGCSSTQSRRTRYHHRRAIRRVSTDSVTGQGADAPADRRQGQEEHTLSTRVVVVVVTHRRLPAQPQRRDDFAIPRTSILALLHRAPQREDCVRPSILHKQLLAIENYLQLLSSSPSSPATAPAFASTSIAATTSRSIIATTSIARHRRS